MEAEEDCMLCIITRSLGPSSVGSGELKSQAINSATMVTNINGAYLISSQYEFQC